MKTPGIIDGVIVAMVISLGAGVASLVLGGFIAHATLFKLLLWTILKFPRRFLGCMFLGTV